MESNIESLAVAPDEAAAFDFRAVFLGRYAIVVKLIARLVNDRGRAEELAAEVFWKLWRNPKAHGPGANGWLYRTAIRMGLDELRKRSRRDKYERLFGFSRATQTPEELHSDEQEQKQVRTVLAAMKARDAELLLLRSDGLSYQEIARVLGVSPTSVGTLLSRAQQTFRREYTTRHGQE